MTAGYSFGTRSTCSDSILRDPMGHSDNSETMKLIKQDNNESDKVPENAPGDDILRLKTIKIGEYSENKSVDLMKGAGSLAC